MATEISVEKNVLHDNDRDARLNRERFRKAGVYVLNLMSAPGAGKTTLLERTVEALHKRINMAVITADIATERDAERLAAFGASVVQLNTGGACHIEAHQIAKSAEAFSLSELQLLIIENIGNLVCPAEFDLGEHDKVMILSCTEGHDKPAKYPLMFQSSRAMILNKIDLLPHTNFSVEAAVADTRKLNPAIEVFQLSATRGDGLDAWLKWLEARVHAIQN